MNVNSLNSISAMQKVSNAPAFKGCTCKGKEVTQNTDTKLEGLSAKGAMSQPCVKNTTLTFTDNNETGEHTVTVGCSLATLDNSLQKDFSPVKLDRKEGQTRREIMKKFIEQTPDIDTCSAQLKDGSVATVSKTDEGFKTTLTKDGESEVIHQYSAGDNKSDIEAFKDFALISLGSLNQSQNPIESITVSAQK